MRRVSAGRTRPEQLPPLPANGSSQAGPGTPWRLLLALLAFGVSSCKGVPVMSHVLQEEKVWNEVENSISHVTTFSVVLFKTKVCLCHSYYKIDDMCSAIPAKDPLSQPSNAVEEFCLMVLEFLQKDKPLATYPLLPFIPQLHDRRQKRYKADEEHRISGGVQSRGYFMFRPRNGRRSAAFY